MTQRTAHTQFAQQIGPILEGEEQSLTTLRELMAQCRDGRLKGLLEAHSRETELQIHRLEQIFDLLGEQRQPSASGQPSTAMHYAQQALAAAQDAPETLDRAIAEAALRSEELEITTYGPIVAAAEHMENKEVRHLLHVNLQEEEQTAHLLKEEILRLSGTDLGASSLRSAPLSDTL